MHRAVIAILIAAFCSALFGPPAHGAPTRGAPTRGAEPPADRVVAMYFHRTKRCPTCQKMGSYAEEAVKQGFPEQIEEGSVAFHYIDFQDEKNAALTKGYKVDGPALIVAKVKDNKVEQYKDLPEIWMKVREKPAFLEYVRSNIREYLP